MNKLKYYVATKGIFVNNPFNYNMKCEDLRINDKEPIETHSRNWLFVEGESEFINCKRKTSGEGYYTFKLNPVFKDKLNVTLPEELSSEEVGYKPSYEDDDDVGVWENDKYSEYRAMYNICFNTRDAYFKDLEYEGKCLGEIEYSIEGNPETFYVKQKDTSKFIDTAMREIDLSSICSWSDLEKMIVPDFLLHTRPCKLSSKQTYDIIRFHVRDNIDPYYATISSDYDFCFVVEKRYRIKPYIRNTEIKKANGRSYARPKFTKRTIEYKEETIYSMTHAERKYGGYHVIAGFEGDSFRQLINNIKMYLEELMEFINEPVHECDKCNGTGKLHTPKTLPKIK
jgi:hypothetical protein